MKRLTFEGNFCDIAQCQDVPGGSFCEDGYCSQRNVWERLKRYEDAEKEGRLFITPVAVGQRLWELAQDFPSIYPETNGWYISSLKITALSTEGFCLGDASLDDYIGYDEIGNGYYLTESEAQEALRKAVEHGTD